MAAPTLRAICIGDPAAGRTPTLISVSSARSAPGLRHRQVHDRLDPLALRIKHRIAHDADDRALHLAFSRSRVGIVSPTGDRPGMSARANASFTTTTGAAPAVSRTVKSRPLRRCAIRGEPSRRHEVELHSTLGIPHSHAAIDRRPDRAAGMRHAWHAGRCVQDPLIEERPVERGSCAPAACRR